MRCWDTLDCYNETYGESGTLGCEHRGKIVLKSKLLPALQSLNPDAPAEALGQAVDELARDRSAMSMVAANQEVYRLLRDGFLAQVQTGESGEAEDYTIQFIEWDDPGKNDFFLASQLWITGEVYTRRADLIGFVNGIPLVFIELKAAHKNFKNAYDDNLTDYKTAIPQLFWYNAFIILSNGSQTRMGSITSAWEHFAEWKKINDEGETGVVSLETVLRGTCERQRLLDIVENFILYQDIQGGTIKVIARYHQYLGVNQSIRAVQNIKDNKGRLGVFWHTQGSGKSFSMVFFSQKVLRKQPGNWTFVVVTDRLELDGQIYKNFVSTGCITEKEARAENAGDLQNLLREDHRYVFSLIQKFRVEKGATYPMLSDRSDVIVVTDEAHRSQYDVFALNMRNALPNAAFIGFTGTPLMAGEEKPRELSEEEQRGIREGLTEEELAIFDILTKPDMTLTRKQEKQVKQAAKGLLETLRREKLGLDWRKRAQTRAQVLLAIEDILDRNLPEVYDEKKYQEKCEYVYQHVYDSYRDAHSSIYATVV